MHPDEIETSIDLVRQLLRAQFPRWADLPIEPVGHRGTDNAIYRLGEERSVRLPRIEWAVQQVEKEHRWLSVLAPHLPAAVPVPEAIGEPAEGYPWPWSVSPWLPGENALFVPFADTREAGRDLAAFVEALQRVDPAGGPEAGPSNFDRGVPLAERDEDVRRAIAQLDGVVDVPAVTRAWEAALEAPVWDAPPVWIHGDLYAGNLLLVDGRLSGVIDWGGLGVGDPAADVMVAWNVLDAPGRASFREALRPDEATWARSRGWAISVAVIILPYYLHTHPSLVREAFQAIHAVLSDDG
jgi:aminoglycoside phosphotransferase (APT) family kinase protein